MAVSVTKVTTQFIRGFAAQVRRSVDEDGKVNFAKLHSGPAKEVLESLQRRSSKPERLIEAAHHMVQGTLEKASGYDGRLSLKDRQEIPAWLMPAYVKAGGRALPKVSDVEAKASAFIEKNAKGSVWDDEFGMFPELDGGEMGLLCSLARGKTAERIVELCTFNDGRAAAKLEQFGYDPDKHVLLCGRVTEDEEQLVVVAYDPASDRGTRIAFFNSVDMTYDMPAEQAQRIFGRRDVADVDPYDLLDALLKGSKDLGVG